ncbi:HTH-type transcriptional repressor CytR [Moorella thermoacetica]|uniref:HTH-type transcriptional repressor CytR n=2 Tax=Neomoorella thermoacetica TaxID=1525 RepID=A0AAC9HGQ8_NEOTH|nr:LacI family DNA-binding transcriptional regulator [Moorella thermoacetica]AOQ23494.1 HTH-type transcriptional repressor CytR [Moorella thermoacetica]TYL13679.1 HTH-type transcriptional repressor CytR [Moorella thermoacetica]
MKTTLKDVAALAGGSLATASLALNNGKGVSAETRQRVLAAARKLNYVQSSIGRNLITGRSYTVGLYILNAQNNPDLTGECAYFYPLLRGVWNVAEKEGYSLNFAVKLWEEIEQSNFIIQKALDQSIDGMIIIPQYTYYYSFLQELERIGFPYVLINPVTCLDRGKSITLDNYLGASLATQYLIDQGVTRLGFINGPPNHHDAIVRERGFIETAARAGIKVDRELIEYGDFTTRSGYQAMNKILEREGAPEGLFCANDYMATGAMHALYNHGYRVPQDVAIIGYDDTDVASSVYPQLSTVRNPTYEIGQAAMQRLLAYIQGETGLPEIVFKPELIIRESCRKKDSQ